MWQKQDSILTWWGLIRMTKHPRIVAHTSLSLSHSLSPSLTRTLSLRYDGRADWSLIARAGQVLRIPVVGNGDVVSVAMARQLVGVKGTTCNGRGRVQEIAGRGCEEQGGNREGRRAALSLPCLPAFPSLVPYLFNFSPLPSFSAGQRDWLRGRHGGQRRRVGPPPLPAHPVLLPGSRTALGVGRARGGAGLHSEVRELGRREREREGGERKRGGESESGFVGSRVAAWPTDLCYDSIGSGLQVCRDLHEGRSRLPRPASWGIG